MTRKFIPILAVVLVLLPAANNGCSRDGELLDQKSSTLGNPYKTTAASDILTATCAVITRCNSQVTMAGCLSGVRGTSGIAERMGLPSTYSNYSSVVDAEQGGIIIANPVSATECLTDLTALACSSPEVTGAYVPTAAEPFGGVREMLDVWQYSCAGVFNSDAILFADGFESGDGSAFNSEEVTASYPATASVPGGCHSGNFCGAQNLRANQTETEGAWNKFVYNVPDHSYIRAYYNFPSSWQFTLNAGRNMDLLQLNWGSCRDGLVIAMRSRGGTGQVADLVAYSAATDTNIHYGNSFTPDGAWHSVELYSSTSDHRVKVWFDGILVIDVADNAGTCAAGEVAFGTYMTSTAPLPKDETFYMDDVAISRQRIGP
jgi:hypothetical protein